VLTCLSCTTLVGGANIGPLECDETIAVERLDDSVIQWCTHTYQPHCMRAT